MPPGGVKRQWRCYNVLVDRVLPSMTPDSWDLADIFSFVVCLWTLFDCLYVRSFIFSFFPFTDVSFISSMACIMPCYQLSWNVPLWLLSVVLYCATCHICRCGMDWNYVGLSKPFFCSRYRHWTRFLLLLLEYRLVYASRLD